MTVIRLRVSTGSRSAEEATVCQDCPSSETSIR